MIAELLKYVCKHLESNKIDYMLSGSIAMSIYAVPRFTRDIDIVINLKQEDAHKFQSIFNENFYFNAKTIEEEIKKKGMFNIIDNTSGYKIDFIIKKDTEFREEEFKRRKLTKVFDFEAWVVSGEDLVISKLIWIQTYHSQIHINDIMAILRNPLIDKPYIKKWCEELKLSTYKLI